MQSEFLQNHSRRQDNPNIHKKEQKTSNRKKITLKGGKQCEKYYNTRLEIILQSYSNKKTRYWHKLKHVVDQMNEIECSEMSHIAAVF